MKHSASVRRSSGARIVHLRQPFRGIWNEPDFAHPFNIRLFLHEELGERTLVPGDDAQLGETRFEDWLSRSTRQT